MGERKTTQFPSPMPEKFIKLLEGFRVSKVLFAACELSIFDKLRSASVPQSASEITQTLSSNLDATTRLMDTLVAMELLEKSKQGDRWLYNNSEMATKFLTTESPDSALGLINLENNISYHFYGNLESAVKEGETQWERIYGKSSEEVFKEHYSTEDDTLRFMSAMHCNSLYGSYAVAKAMDLSEYSSCCDLGGK